MSLKEKFLSLNQQVIVEFLKKFGWLFSSTNFSSTMCSSITVNDFSHWIRILCEWGNRTPCIKRIRLFGSYAKGTPSKSSDLDIAVEIETIPGDESPLITWVFEAANWRDDLQPRIDIPLHLEWYDPAGETPKVAQGLADAQRLVYEKNS